MVTPQELHNYLKTNPGFSWATLPAKNRELMSALVRPTGSFSQEQTDFLKDFWLVVSPEQLKEMQGKLPSRLRLTPRETLDGSLCLLAALLTDSQRPGDTWHAIAEPLAQLEIRYILPEEFPAVAEDE